MKKILITGASGFIGSFIIEEALRQGMETWAAVRRSSSREYLKDGRIHFIELDFSSSERLREQLMPHRFDYVVHAAGVTKCLHRDDFFRVNRDGTRNLVTALQALGQPLERFVFLSSLSIFGAIREQQPYTEIEPTDTPRPNTAYGKSKLEAERCLSGPTPPLPEGGGRPDGGQEDMKGNDIQEQQDGSSLPFRGGPGWGFPYIILRPTGVYGPREKDYFLMAKSIKGHTDFAVGYRQQDITFVYVKDVVQAVFLALDHGKPGSAYFLSDGNVYRSTTFSDLIHEELGRPWWIRITAPIWLLRIVTFLGDLIGHLTGKISALNNDKYQILRQRNWRCNIRPAVEELGYRPQYDLRRGVAETIRWYKENSWL